MSALSILRRSGCDISGALWSSRPHHQQEQQQPDEHSCATGGDTMDVEANPLALGESPMARPERRESKRRMLRNMISRSIRGAGRASSPQQQQQKQQQLPLQRWRRSHSQAWNGNRATATATATATVAPAPAPAPALTPAQKSSPPRPAINKNKPLPSPPLPGSKQDIGPPLKPVLKLDRIMATLSDDDVEKLFAGAPQYFARSEGHYTGAPHPSVAYPWDETLEVRDLTDHIRIEHEAWSCVTSWPHITRRKDAVSAHVGRAAGSEHSTSDSTSASESAKSAKSADSARRAGCSEMSLPLPEHSDSPPVKKRSHFYPRCRERPSMLSIQGLEKGTIGYEAALELSVSDALLEEQFGFDGLGPRPPAIVEARRKIMDPAAAASAGPAPTSTSTLPATLHQRPPPKKDGKSADSSGPQASTESIDTVHDENTSGLQNVGETQILEELIKNGKRYADGSFYDERQSKEFYNELFRHIIRAPKSASKFAHLRTPSLSVGGGSSDHLTTQIEALLDVLATPNVWIDFSHVEWRLRLGQILWASSPEDDILDGMKPASAARPATPGERYTERYWLLLQILLATELLLRLDAITDGNEYGLEYVRPAEVHRFEKEANQSVRWSLILARAWLENIEIIRVDDTDSTLSVASPATGSAKEGSPSQPGIQPGSKPGSQPETGAPLNKTTSHGLREKLREAKLRHTIGWITTLTKKLSVAEAHLHSPTGPVKKHVYAMKARYVHRQQRGVAFFAQELRWPGEFSSPSCNTVELLNRIAASAAQAANNSALSLDTSTGGMKRVGSRLEFNRQLQRRRKVIAGLHTGGWLTKSYLSGLILPGDGLCNLLMASLLESDDAALKTLGPVAHLGAGFVYRGKSFWSTVCVVGRVLAAGAGAIDCMGWISSDVLPNGRGDGWFNVSVEDVEDDIRHTNRRARIWGKSAIERESSVLGDADPASLLPADFVIPHEGSYKTQPPTHTTISLESFSLHNASETEARSQAERAEKADTDANASHPLDEKAKPTQTYLAKTTFSVDSDGEATKAYTYNLSYDVYFVTAHPCVPSKHVKVLKSPTSPTIQQIDLTGLSGKASFVATTSHPLHKYYTFASIHLSTLIKESDKSLEEFLAEYLSTPGKQVKAASGTSGKKEMAKVLVVDCITGFTPQPAANEMPMSPITRNRPSFDGSSISSLPPLTKEISPIASMSPPAAQPVMLPTDSKGGAAISGSSMFTPKAGAAAPVHAPSLTATAAEPAMHQETRRRRFGSDMEIMVRAICAERGWNALISRRRRGCLSCAIREASALSWKVVIRVD